MITNTNKPTTNQVIKNAGTIRSGENTQNQE